MAYKVNFKEGEVEAVGFESSPVTEALAGLRANEARYFWNKYKFEYLTYPAAEKAKEVALIEKILKDERDIVMASPILEVATYEDDSLYWPEFYYENGLCINLLWEKQGANGRPAKHAVGFKLSLGMEIPDELSSFKFARQKSKLAGEVRGSFFVVKGNYL